MAPLKSEYLIKQYYKYYRKYGIHSTDKHQWQIRLSLFGTFLLDVLIIAFVILTVKTGTRNKSPEKSLHREGNTVPISVLE